MTKRENAPQANSPVPGGRRTTRLVGQRGRTENRTLLPLVFVVAIACYLLLENWNLAPCYQYDSKGVWSL